MSMIFTIFLISGFLFFILEAFLTFLVCLDNFKRKIHKYENQYTKQFLKFNLNSKSIKLFLNVNLSLMFLNLCLLILKLNR